MIPSVAPPPDPLKSLPTDVDLDIDPEAALARLPTDLDLPYSDGMPMDSPWHRACMNLLIESVEGHWRGRKDFYVGGDMFLYFSTEHVFNKDFRGPDVFVVLNVEHDKPRRSWVMWQEGGKMPDLIIELSSPSTKHIDREEKKKLYAATFRTQEYFIYDPETETLEGWTWTRYRYDKAVPVDSAGRAVSRILGASLGTFDCEYQGHRSKWLRLFSSEGQLIPTAEELVSAEKARADAAEAELAQLRTELAALKQPPQP